MEDNKQIYCNENKFLAFGVWSDFDAVVRYLKELQSEMVLY